MLIDDDNPPRHGLEAFLRGAFGNLRRTTSDRPTRGDWHARSFVVLSLIQRARVQDHQLSAGDPVMSLVANEIWLYNIGRFAERSGCAHLSERLDGAERGSLVPCCNAYSIAQALGLAHETVRRKIAKLQSRGWIERSQRGQLHVTRRWEEEVLSQLVANTVSDLAAAHAYLNIGPEKKPALP
ncbi:MAG: hypothetical protein KDG52_05440 [Rhodocyclaceae bacterium]|nr:hypothetical protein [Rhodocyclaceae bacterium]